MRFWKSKRKDALIKPSKRKVRNRKISEVKSSQNQSLLMVNKEQLTIACLSM